MCAFSAQYKRAHSQSNTQQHTTTHESLHTTLSPLTAVSNISVNNTIHCTENTHTHTHCHSKHTHATHQPQVARQQASVASAAPKTAQKHPISPLHCAPLLPSSALGSTRAATALSASTRLPSSSSLSLSAIARRTARRFAGACAAAGSSGAAPSATDRFSDAAAAPFRAAAAADRPELRITAAERGRAQKLGEVSGLI